MEARESNNTSIQEYIAIEEENNCKYEFHDGKLMAMAGGTLEHGLICGNIFAELRNALKKQAFECSVLNSEIKLYIEAKNTFVYPDAMVICDEIETSEKEKNAVTNPVVIVEVLSKLTESYDRGDKFYLYRQIPKFKEYILIEQYKKQVEIYQKNGDLWKITRYNEPEKKFKIQTLEIELELDLIYEGVTFPKSV